MILQRECLYLLILLVQREVGRRRVERLIRFFGGAHALEIRGEFCIRALVGISAAFGGGLFALFV